jgi:hypothetical protein
MDKKGETAFETAIVMFTNSAAVALECEKPVISGASQWPYRPGSRCILELCSDNFSNSESYSTAAIANRSKVQDIQGLCEELGLLSSVVSCAIAESRHHVNKQNCCAVSHRFPLRLVTCRALFALINAHS